MAAFFREYEMIESLIVNILSGLVCLAIERVTDPKKKSKRKKQSEINIAKNKIWFYIWLALAYASFICEVTNGSPFWLRFVAAGVAGVSFTKCVVLFYRVNQIAEDANQALSQKCSKKHSKESISKPSFVIHPAAQTRTNPARLQGFCVLHGVGGGNRTHSFHKLI